MSAAIKRPFGAMTTEYGLFTPADASLAMLLSIEENEYFGLENDYLTMLAMNARAELSLADVYSAEYEEAIAEALCEKSVPNDDEPAHPVINSKRYKSVERNVSYDSTMTAFECEEAAMAVPVM